MAEPSIKEVFDLAAAHLQAGRLPQAEAIFQQILQKRPDHDGALNGLGIVQFQSGNKEAGLQFVLRAVAVNDSQPEFLSNLGRMLHAVGRDDEAIDAFNRAIRLKPDYAEALNQLGSLLHAKRKFTEAIDQFRRAVQLRPNSALMQFNLASALDENGDVNGAIGAYQESIRLNPDLAEAYNNLALVLKACDHTEAAIAALERTIQLQPNNAEALTNLAGFLRDRGQLDAALILYDKALAAQPHFGPAASARLVSLNLHPHFDPKQLLHEHQRWNKAFAQPLRNEILPLLNDRSPDRRLRIGYVSPDFRQHSVAFFLESFLKHRDRAAFEIFCFSDVAKPDQATERFQQIADHWHDSAHWSYARLAEQIRTDQIDILVDLTGHTASNRLRTFARKPAPIQVTYCGYPNTTGLMTMDYRLTDTLADPPGETDALYVEKLVRLPRTFLCYQPPADAPPVGPLPALAGGGITFGSFNALVKITAPMIAIWSEILQQVPRSRLLIKSFTGLSDQSPRQRLFDLFQSMRIGADRLEILPQIPQPSAHLQLYNRVDIALDTFPYHGTATTCEALWMGAPVITLAGKAHVSRVGVSLLSNVGLGEFIAEQPEKYVALAVGLAKDPSRLAELRAGMRERLTASPLLDGRQFARDIEAAYRQMWRTWSTHPI